MRSRGLLLLTASALALTGCATAAPSDDDGRLQVVASTNVYGDIATTIGGDLISVTSIIDSAAQDPHAYEATARDQLTVSRADLVIENGGGYDAFVDDLLTDDSAPVIVAAELSPAWPTDAEGDHAEEDHAEDDHADEDHSHDHDHDHDHVEGFNEHVWYDPTTMDALAQAIGDELSELDPDNAAAYSDGVAEFRAGIADIQSVLDGIAASSGGTEIFVTEPVPLYLTEAAGLVNESPAAFTEAVEEGQDVPPATLLEAQELIDSGHIAVLIANVQTGGAETTAVIEYADAADVPVIEFSELVPDGSDYLAWMQQNADDLAATLAE